MGPAISGQHPARRPALDGSNLELFARAVHLRPRPASPVGAKCGDNDEDEDEDEDAAELDQVR